MVCKGILRDGFEHKLKREYVDKDVYKELDVMKGLKDYENIVKLLDLSP